MPSKYSATATLTAKPVSTRRLHRLNRTCLDSLNSLEDERIDYLATIKRAFQWRSLNGERPSVDFEISHLIASIPGRNPCGLDVMSNFVVIN
jgi:hypothetical protein